jgi:hypothetical protein
MIVTCGALCALSFLSGFLLNRAAVRKAKMKMMKAEQEMLNAHAELLELQARMVRMEKSHTAERVDLLLRKTGRAS